MNSIASQSETTPLCGSTAKMTATPPPQELDTLASPSEGASSSSSAGRASCCSLGELADACEALAELTTQPLDVSCSVKVLRIQRACRPLMIRVLQAREREASRLGTSNGNGAYHLPGDALEEYRAAMKPVLSEIISIPAAGRLILAELSGAKISPGNLERMAPLLSDL
jgi:hypothetical protein